jgi:hypothetical protein
VTGWPDDAAWYAVIALFGVAAPLALRSFQDRIPLNVRESHQALTLALVWLGVQLASERRPPNRALVIGWLFIYAVGSLVLLFGRVGGDGDKGGDV